MILTRGIVHGYCDGSLLAGSGNTEQRFNIEEIYQMFPEQCLILRDVEYENDFILNSNIKSACILIYGLDRYTAKASEYHDDRNVYFSTYLKDVERGV